MKKLILGAVVAAFAAGSALADNHAVRMGTEGAYEPYNFINDKGEIYVIEVNPNPDVAEGDELCRSAEQSGLSYPELLQRIINLGLAYEPEWRRTSA